MSLYEYWQLLSGWHIIISIKRKTLRPGICAFWPILIRRLGHRSEVAAPVWDQMAELPMPHQWPTSYAKMPPTWGVCPLRKQVEQTGKSAWQGRDNFQMSQKKEAYHLTMHTGRGMTWVFPNCPVRDVSDCSAEKCVCDGVCVCVGDGNSRENTECIPGSSAPICASTTRSAAQCQSSMMTGGLLLCTVLGNKQKQPVTFYNHPLPLHGPIFFFLILPPYNAVWHSNIHRSPGSFSHRGCTVTLRL